MIPTDLPEGLTLEDLRAIWGRAEAEDFEALAAEDDRVIRESEIERLVALMDTVDGSKIVWGRPSGR